jgi:D-methionine transport system permease protein
LEHIDAGRIIVDGSDLSALDELGLNRVRHKIGMIFQHFNLLSMKTVFENVELPLKLAGLVALIPFTRLIVGTTIGTTAAIVPLAIAATPYYARVAEMSLREVDRGLIEALRALGATRWQIVREALVPEALPGLVSGFTVTLVTLIGASAMAGAVGAGGLGDLAIRYGYQRFETDIMVGVIIVLIVIVSGVQIGGDLLARRLNRRL